MSEHSTECHHLVNTLIARRVPMQTIADRVGLCVSTVRKWRDDPRAKPHELGAPAIMERLRAMLKTKADV